MPHFLEVTLQYEARLGGKTAANQYASESNPKLSIFLTHNLSRGVVAAKQTPGQGETLQFTVPFAGAAAAAAQDPMPASSSLGINAYAVTYTETGQQLESRVGSGYVLLQTLLEGTVAAERGPLQVPLTDTTGDDGVIVKGMVRVLRARMLADEGEFTGQKENNVAQLAFAEPKEWSVTDADQGTFQGRQMRAMQEASMEFFFGQKPVIAQATIAYLERVHCPEYRTEALSLPGSAFSLRLPKARPHGAVFLRNLEVTLWRLGWLQRSAVDSLNETIERQFDNPRAEVSGKFHAATTLLVGVLTVFCTNEVYENDFVNEGGNTILPTPTRERMRARMRQAAAAQAGSPVGGVSRSTSDALRVPITESFKVIRGLGGGDCEDVAFEVYTEAAQFMRFDFASADDSDLAAAGGTPGARLQLARLLGNLQRILSLYVPMLVLMAVTNKKMEDGLRDMAPDEAMAHTVAVFFPWAQFFAAFDSETAPQDARAMMRSRAWGKAWAADTAWHKQLRVLVAEGTARMDARACLPYTYWQDSEEQRAKGWAVVQAKREAQERVQKAFAGERAGCSPVSLEILPSIPTDTQDKAFARNKQDVSGFYKAPVSAYVGGTFKDGGVCEIVFAVRGSGTAKPRALTYGAHFNRLVFPELLQDKALRIVPAPRYTPLQMRIVQDALQKLEPEPTLRLSREALASDADNKVVRALQQHLLLPGETSRVRAVGTETGAVVLSLRDQEASAGNVAKLIRAARAVIGGSQKRAQSVQIRTWTLADPAASDGDSIVRNIVHDVRIDVLAE